MEDIQRIIRPYPKHKEADAILAKMEDDTWIPEGECAYEEEGEGKSDDDEDEDNSEEELNEEEEEAADLAALDAICGYGDAHDVRSSGYGDVEDVRQLRRNPDHWLRYQSRCIDAVANTHRRARDGHGVPQGSRGAGICCTDHERNPK